jgi:hypothetical protein
VFLSWYGGVLIEKNIKVTAVYWCDAERGE